MKGKKFSHYPRLLSRAVTLVSQLYHGEITRSDFDVFYKFNGYLSMKKRYTTPIDQEKNMIYRG